ncbi:AAA family ATPase ['Paenibacillus yunnanensis' Narsing Rao et al. 2020]|uniref:AAA family ATPase n=1 Tax=Paenibacillus tengchongensis TaxID=2608684 RepID=UPI00124D3B4C|nr:AAA family ATPase [Paenibacillus tengchongensis]
MKRLVVITVGKTHSGKTTFAKKLEQHLNHSVVIDRDNHAEFIHTYYKSLLPKQGVNTLKDAISRTIIDFAANQTNFHIILCNANRGRKGRLDLLEWFRSKGFVSIIVNFDIPDAILLSRIADSQRSTAILRNASTFEEVLSRQLAGSHNDDVLPPTSDEAHHLLVIKDSNEVQSTIQEIVQIARSLANDQTLMNPYL